MPSESSPSPRIERITLSGVGPFEDATFEPTRNYELWVRHPKDAVACDGTTQDYDQVAVAWGL